VYDRVTWGSSGYLRLHVLRYGAQSDRLYQSSRRHPRTYILTYLLQKTTFSKIFWALSEGPRGSTPASSDSSPRATYPGIFSRLSTSILTKGFTQALPTSNATPTLTHSDPTPRVTYLGIFSRLSTSILTLAFTQALPPLTSPLHQHRVRIPFLALRTLRFSLASTYILTKGFIQALPTSNVTPTPTPSSDPPPRVTHHRIFPRHSTSIYGIFKTVLLSHSQHPTPPLRQHLIRIPLFALPTLGFFPVSLRPF